MGDFMKIYFLIGLFVSSFYSFGQQDFSDSDMGFTGELIEDVSCLSSYNGANNNKIKAIQKRQPNFFGFKLGKNQLGSSFIFIGEGQADIRANKEDDNYISSVQTAISLAGVRAKNELAKFRDVETTRDLIEDAIQARSSGQTVADFAAAKVDLDKRQEEYEQQNLLNKFVGYLHKKLDDGIGNDFMGERADLETQLEGILAQDSVKEVIQTIGYSEISGMRNIYLQVSEKKVCVLSVSSNRTKRWAGLLGENNYIGLKALRPGKKFMNEIIPDKKDPDGLKALSGMYGLYMDVDPKGEIYFVSYAQSGAIDRTSSSLSRSKTIAENIARSQIAQFQSEALDIFSRLEKAELNTTYKDGMIQTYSEENLVARTRAASRLNIKGVETYDWWATVHPYTKKPVVGVILTWQPSNAVMQESSTETTTFDDLGF